MKTLYLYIEYRVYVNLDVLLLLQVCSKLLLLLCLDLINIIQYLLIVLIL